jgi:hypothetical protein
MRDMPSRGGCGRKPVVTGGFRLHPWKLAKRLSIYSAMLTFYLISDNVHHARVRYVDFFMFRGERDSAEVLTHLGSVAYRRA